MRQRRKKAQRRFDLRDIQRAECFPRCDAVIVKVSGAESRSEKVRW